MGLHALEHGTRLREAASAIFHEPRWRRRLAEADAFGGWDARSG